MTVDRSPRDVAVSSQPAGRRRPVLDPRRHRPERAAERLSGRLRERDVPVWIDDGQIDALEAIPRYIREGLTQPECCWRGTPGPTRPAGPTGRIRPWHRVDERLRPRLRGGPPPRLTHWDVAPDRLTDAGRSTAPGAVPQSGGHSRHVPAGRAGRRPPGDGLPKPCVGGPERAPHARQPPAGLGRRATGPPSRGRFAGLLRRAGARGVRRHRAPHPGRVDGLNRVRLLVLRRVPDPTGPATGS